MEIRGDRTDETLPRGIRRRPGVATDAEDADGAQYGVGAVWTGIGEAQQRPSGDASEVAPPGQGAPANERAAVGIGAEQPGVSEGEQLSPLSVDGTDDEPRFDMQRWGEGADWEEIHEPAEEEPTHRALRVAHAQVQSLLSAGDLAGARAVLDGVAAAYPELQAEARLLEAHQLERYGWHEAALHAYERVAHAYPEAAVVAVAYSGMADSLSTAGQNEEAIDWYQRAQTLHAEVGELAAAARIDLDLAQCLLAVGRVGEAADLIESLLLAGPADDRKDDLDLRYVEMQVRSSQGRSVARQLHHLYREAKGKDDALAARALYWLAEKAIREDRIAAAAELYLAARELFQREGLVHRAAHCDDSLAFVLEVRRDFSAAIALHRAALEVYLSRNLEVDAAGAEFGLGWSLHMVSRFEAALDVLASAHSRYAAAGMSHAAAEADLRQVLPLVRLNRTDEARQLLEDRRLEMITADEDSRASTLWTEAVLLRAEGHSASAERMFRAASSWFLRVGLLASARECDSDRLGQFEPVAMDVALPPTAKEVRAGVAAWCVGTADLVL